MLNQIMSAVSRYKRKTLAPLAWNACDLNEGHRDLKYSHVLFIFSIVFQGSFSLTKKDI